ncbi:hypothetical protein [Micromonospora sp. NBC_01796]|uniref:hypothetical protein n=1 Tax=Micromonospora sp. NBC_01796 TaxID=2975987 RepID=UPI002DDB0CD9|nr:hypothetical protein [Micromonospora sp. NBC_01796]WSA84914.1 hypothetical protein OIE47_31890 [Micromonospora sp. NBC_01796]
MKRIIEIVPARPGWYSRWRLAPDATRSYPVTVWALVEDADGASREVIGVDSVGQWPGADDNEPGADFVRYLFQPPDTGHPDDADQARVTSGSGVPTTLLQPAPSTT